MENFIVSARKYRPITFDSVVGQAHITDTLKTAIKNNKLAQAFLFCGPRGVGKTTSARILAKTINCQNLKENIEPCNECESCKTFENNQSLNIYELDAASNNSVDDIRSLIDQVRFAPQQGTHKVYIIDEVHMLSTAAFNAFLKTLEEPPAHAIFILATTEKHKILPTILSRCQIFDFRRIQITDIAQHLSFVAEKENIKYDSDALYLIGQKADGAMRDALSMFDQLSNFTNNEVIYEKVVKNLNILDYGFFFEIVDMALENNISGCLQTFDKILQLGFDGQDFIAGLAKHLRDILVCKNPETLFLLEVGEQLKSQYSSQAENCQPNFIKSGIEICYECENSYRLSKNKRLTVELSLMKLASITQMDQKKKSRLGYGILPFAKNDSIAEHGPSKEYQHKKPELSTTAINANVQDAKIVIGKPATSIPSGDGKILNIQQDNLSIQDFFK
ncbi:MAG: DNA polymerase III subunit gamma/tau, partial [Flavobacteriales bacterium]|nr:DNA polymerase III subunit gamma/tau [Flavobacteriales bacterium]